MALTLPAPAVVYDIRAGKRVDGDRWTVTLGKGGGAMAKMIPAFKFFAGGSMGSGRQWFPWIHISDLISAIQFFLEAPSLSGPFNLSAPNPVRNRELSSTLGRVLGRPSFLPAPRSMLRLALGEVGAVLVESQRAVPHQLLASGFNFQYPEIEPALRNIVGQKDAPSEKK